MKLYLYILLYEDKMIYVGFTNNFNTRLKAHISGNGSIHTKDKGDPFLELSWPIEVRNRQHGRLEENHLAEQLRSIYGPDIVRGGELKEKFKKRLQRKVMCNQKI